MKRMPELDALRAFAALVVLLFHLDPRRYLPGWSGVDLFFVLSGYLITSIILKNSGTRGFLWNFYARRSLRIWPIYYLTVLGIVAANPLLPKPSSLASIPYILTFTPFIMMYWGRQPVPMHQGLEHTWTLAIEEQFYLIWPALVLWAGPKRFVTLCLLTISIALVTRSSNNGIFPAFHERMLLARCDGFAIGGLLAWFLGEGSWATRNRSQSSGIFGAIIGLSMVYFAWGCWSMTALSFIGLPTPAYRAETILAFGVLYGAIIGLIVVQSGAGWLKPLRFGPLLYLGKISYGLYLYHYVVYWIIDGCSVDPGALKTNQDWPIQCKKLVVSLLVAMISWHLIEQPILRLKDRFDYRAETR